MDCQLEPTPDARFCCSRCGWEHPKLVRRNCPVPPDPAVIARRTARRSGEMPVKVEIALETPVVGPGTELKLLLRKFFIEERLGCGCDNYAKMMDREGPDWCVKHLEEIADHLEREAKKRRLPFIRTLGRILVRRAARNARKKLEMLK